jgi:hypothetical protein
MTDQNTPGDLQNRLVAVINWGDGTCGQSDCNEINGCTIRTNHFQAERIKSPDL